MTPDYASPEQLRGRPSHDRHRRVLARRAAARAAHRARPYDLTGTHARRLVRQQLHARVAGASRATSSSAPARRPAARGRDAARRRRGWRRGSPAISTRSCCARSRPDPPRATRSSSSWPAISSVTARSVRSQRAAHAICPTCSAVRAGGIAGASRGAGGRAAARRRRGRVVWQARVAAEARARAERRFDDVRRLAQSFMFDVHDAIVERAGHDRSARR